MQLIEYFNSLEKLTAQDTYLLEQHVKTITVKKGQIFLESGKISNKIGFINEGIMRSFFYDKNGKEFTYCFITKGGVVTDPISFYKQTLSSQYITAEAETSLTYFTFDSCKLFEKEIPNWQSIIKKATEASLAAKVIEKGHMLAEDATTRYLNFSEKHPEIIQNVPLKTIASFLGITRYSISRIRKNIARK